MKIFGVLGMFDNLRIQYKLFLAYFLVTVLPVAAIGYVSYSSSARYLQEQSINIVSQLQQNTIVNINKRLDGYLFLANTVYNNRKLQKFISGNYVDYYEEYDLVNGFIEPVLQSLLDATGKGVYLAIIRYGDTGNEIMVNNFEGMMEPARTSPNFVRQGQKFYHIVNAGRMEGKKWFQALKGHTDTYRWTQVGEDENYGNISLVREINDLWGENRNKVGLLRLTVGIPEILSDEKVASTGENGFNLVFDSHNRLLSIEKEKRDFTVMYSRSIQECLALPGTRESLMAGDKLLLRGTVNAYGWKIISVIPIDRLMENINKIRNNTIVYCLISTIILSFVTFIISTSFSRRITKIARQMEKFKKGSFDAKVRDVKKDELGFLASVFNDMTDRINSLIRDNYQANIDKKDAQLHALQAQINPHFLYNSMSAIGRLAEIGENDSIRSMVKALTKFYRMTLNKGRDIISISDELEQVKAYIDVFKVRKGECFEVFYDIEEEIVAYHTVKVILQPFVENIFEHGLFIRKNPLTIFLTVKQEGTDVVFRILDDGIGIPRERLEHLFNESKVSGYGIKNVDERIKLQFGEAYGVRIDSILGAGTLVTVRIPKYMHDI